ncbi:hypothetical protein HPB48_026064 [Haemaphysalis longicornis]|uniref:Uncharacterized protein n=1 Tax=Haemaphysalis longicornis TaxID=44386 RepID=A0A9J6HAW5_HAELO|nr:hypothetical protein HPB48_026064 [Haemaphysalis longicornis]
MADYYSEATVRRGSSTGSPQPNELHEVLNHGLDCADGLRLLKPTSDKSAAFFRYFQDDTTPAAALAPHKTKLARQEHGEGLLASGAVNPSASTVYHWFCGWWRGQYGDEGGKANRWQQSLNSSSCLWIPSHSWRPRAQLEAVTNKIYEEWWRQPSLAAGNPYYATALQQLLRQMHKIRKKGAPGRSLPMKAGFTSARRCGCTVKVQPTSIARRRPGVNRGPGSSACWPRARLARRSSGPHALNLSVRDGCRTPKPRTTEGTEGT